MLCLSADNFIFALSFIVIMRIKYLLLLLGFLFLSEIAMSVPGKKPANESNKNSHSEIEGVWSSYTVLKYQGIKKVTIKKIKENKFRASLRLEDGTNHVEFLTLDENGEYHTYNRYREYYKIANGTLVAYDEEGFLFYLWKNGS
jgi:hypothetical protein